MNKSKILVPIIVLITALAAFLITVVALADERKSGVSQLKGISVGESLHAVFLWNRTIHVRCDRGATITRALRRAREGDTLKIHGTCTEAVVITKDRLTLAGIGGATVDGSGSASEAVVLIDGARGFTIRDLHVQNGADQGILATRQAQGELSNVTMSNNRTVGLSVDRAHLDLEEVSMDGNGTGGMDAYAASTVLARGRISANNNGGDGLAINGQTYLELRGAAVTASQNIGSGISVINDSRLQIFSFPEAQGSSVIADSNGFAGIGVLGSELSVVGSQFFGSGANVISATNNALFGFFMPAGSIISPHATAKFIAENNRVGMLMEDGASALIIGGLNITDNGAGISAVGAGTLTLVSVPPNPSTVDLNRVDIDLGFGTRATIDGVNATSVVCDATALLRGTLSCPSL